MQKRVLNNIYFFIEKSIEDYDKKEQVEMIENMMIYLSNQHYKLKQEVRHEKFVGNNNGIAK